MESGEYQPLIDAYGYEIEDKLNEFIYGIKYMCEHLNEHVFVVLTYFGHGFELIDHSRPFKNGST